MKAGRGGSPSGNHAAQRGPGAAVAGTDDRINILIVDDEPKNLLVLETLLDNPEYRLVRANSADQALLSLIEEEFALIILDINLPGMSGFELAQMVRARKKTSLIPIIFLTAYYNEDQHVLEGYAAGAVDYLHKPVNKNILRSKVATFADLYRSTRALQAEIAERRLAQEQLRAVNETLEQRVVLKTEALRQTDAQLRAMIDALPAAVYATDANGYLTHFNSATVELSGRMPTLGVDRWCTTWKLYREDGSPMPHDECPMAVALRDGRAIRGMKIVVERPDGRRAWVMPYPTPLRDPAGNVVGGINMLVDITDAKRAADELSAAKLAAEGANAAKSDFLANMSHEIRTPMNAILGFTNLLSEVVESPVEREWVQSIKKGGELLLAVINDVLDLSKIEAGKLVLNRQPADVVDIVDNMIAMFRPQADEKGITLERNIDAADVEPLLIDYQRLRQVLMNLVSNAVKFTERGRVTINVELSEGKAPGLRDLSLTVADTGVGIPEGQVSQIFDPFQQADSPDGKLRQGTGLGLTISRRLVDAMGGSIELLGAKGEGTTFVVRLPDLVVSDEPVTRSEPSEAVDFNRLPPMRLLVVDDVAWNLEVASGYLRNSHHEVHVAHDGQEGVSRTRELRPDVVLMDLRMPVMNGYEARDAIRADPALDRIWIVAVTASSAAQDEAGRCVGFDACVRKPYSPRDLFDALSQLTGVTALDTAPGIVVPQALAPLVWNRELQSRWRQLQQVELPVLASRMRMREIGEFAGRLHRFSLESRYVALQDLADALGGSVQNFNAKATGETLHRIAGLPGDFLDS
jgi:PAS domain S-box-containing protein